MRLAIGYATSALVHVVVLGGLAIWKINDWPFSYSVASGQAITVQFSPAVASEATEASVVVEHQPVEEPPRETPPSTEPLQIQRQLAVVEIAEEQFRVEAPVEESQADPPPPEWAKSEPRDEPTLAEHQPPARNPTADPPQTQVASVPLEFQSASVAGAVAEQSPRAIVNPSPIYPDDALRARIF